MNYFMIQRRITGIPVHMHIVAAQVQAVQHLEDDGAGRVEYA